MEVSSRPDDDSVLHVHCPDFKVEHPGYYLTVRPIQRLPSPESWHWQSKAVNLNPLKFPFLTSSPSVKVPVKKVKLSPNDRRGAHILGTRVPRVYTVSKWQGRIDLRIVD